MSKEASGGVFNRADARRITSQTFIGQDLVPRPRRLALMNLFLHSVEPYIYLGDNKMTFPNKTVARPGREA